MQMSTSMPIEGPWGMNCRGTGSCQMQAGQWPQDVADLSEVLEMRFSIMSYSSIQHADVISPGQHKIPISM